MVLIHWLVGLALLTQGCMSSLGQAEVGCKTWRQKGDDVCCDECHPGNRLIQQCGPRPKELCKPCEHGTFTLDPRTYRCTRCSQCVGAQVHFKDCTIKSDTQCGCRDGLICGNDKCSFCVEKCDKGYEPTDNYSCRPCPHGTYNNKSHGECKPWSKCLDPNQVMVANGSASSDIQCQKVTVEPVSGPKEPGRANEMGTMVLYKVIITVMMTLFITTIILVIILAVKVNQKRKKSEKQPKTQQPIIRTPTDDPRTLIAIECSFHEAQQEQGSSTDSLIKEFSEFTALTEIQQHTKLC